MGLLFSLRAKTSTSFPCLFLFSHDRVSICRPGCPGTHNADQAGFKHTVIHLCLLRAGPKGVGHHSGSDLVLTYIKDLNKITMRQNNECLIALAISFEPNHGQTSP